MSYLTSSQFQSKLIIGNKKILCLYNILALEELLFGKGAQNEKTTTFSIYSLL